MKKFILIVEDLSEKDEEILIEYFSRHGLGWWHWIDNAWLLTSHNKDMCTTNIRDEVQELGTSGNILVLEIKKNIDWSGFGPTTKKQNMFKWIRKTWHKEL